MNLNNRINNLINNFWNTSKSFFKEIKSLIINVFILGLILILSYSIIKEINNDSIFFNATDVPQEFSERGLTGIVVSRRIVDEINYIKEVVEDSVQYKILSNEKIPSIVLPNSSPELNFEIPKTGLYYSNIIGFFKRYFNKETSTINSDIVTNGRFITLTLRYKNFSYYKTTNKDSLNVAIRSVSTMLLEDLQPLTVAIYYFKENKSVECDKIIKHNLYKFSKSQLSRAYLILSIISGSKNRIVKAENLANQSIEADSANIFAYCLLYAIQKQQTQKSDYSLLAKALSLPNKSAYDNYVLGDLYERDEKLVEAEALYKKALLMNPNLYPVYLDLANLKKKQNKLNEAKGYYYKILTFKPYDIDAHVKIADIFTEQKNYKEAEEYLRDAISINPKLYSTYNNLADLKFKEGNIDEAEKQYKFSLKLNPKKTETLESIASFYFDIKSYKKSAYYYKSITRIDPKYPFAYYNYGAVLYNQKKYRQAKSAFKSAIRINPNDTSSIKSLNELKFY